MTKQNCRMAAIQMVSGPRVADNLQVAGRLIEDAVAQGAELLALPEYFPVIGAADADRVRAREDFGQRADPGLAGRHRATPWHLDFCRFPPVDRDKPRQDAQFDPGLQSGGRLRRALRQGAPVRFQEGRRVLR